MRTRRVKSRVLWWLVEAASFRVVVCWFSACCGVMPPRARWGRRVLYQWTQAAVSRVGFQSGWFPSNVARNSRAHISDIEMWSLELQRLWPISKNDRVKLRATFAGVVTVVTFRSHYSPGVVPVDPGGGFTFDLAPIAPGAAHTRATPTRPHKPPLQTHQSSPASRHTGLN